MHWKSAKELGEGFLPLPPDLQGWNSTDDVFKKLIDEVNPQTIIEIGSWKGMSALHMASLSDANIYCVDTWLGAEEFYREPTKERSLLSVHGYPQVYYQFLSNVLQSPYADRIHPVPLPSSVAVTLLPSADLIYIDGSHEYADVRDDIERYKDKAPILFGDDYGNTDFRGVKQAVDEICTPQIINNWFWIWRK